MHSIQVTHEFSCPADTLWQITGDFGGLKAWLPGVVACNVAGEGAKDNGGNAVRTVQLMDGSVTRESLDSVDAEARRYVYSVLEAKGFDANSQFQATFQVLARDGGRCAVVWSAAFTLPANLPVEKVNKARSRIEQMYQFFLQHLQTMLNADR